MNHPLRTMNRFAVASAAALLMTGAAQAQCLDDIFEPNETCAGAVAITPGTYLGLNLDAGLQDWYTLSLPAGDFVDVDLTFIDALGDIDLRIEAPCGTFQASGPSTTDNESVFWVNDTGATVQVGIRCNRFGTEVCPSYDMQIQTGTPAPCLDDAFEPNETCLTASPITAGMTTGLNVDTGLEDWYTINVPAGDTLDVDALFIDTDGDIDGRLEAPCGTFRNSANTSDDNESLFWHNTTGAAVDAFIRIDKDGAELCTPYALNVVVTTPPPCLDDAFEPNETCVTASPITPGAATGLNLDNGLEDWYSIVVPAGDVLDVFAFFIDTDGDIDARLEAPCGTFRDSSNTSDDNEDMTWFNNTGSPVTAVIRIDKDGPELCVPYDLNIVLTTPPPCLDDAFEPNESCVTASPIAAGSTTGLNLDTGLEDWYSIVVPAGDFIDVNVLFIDTDGDIDARLEAPCGTFQDSSNTSTDNEDMAWFNDTGLAVTAVIRIDKDGSEMCTAYDMSITLTTPPPCLDDAFEPNDTCGTASLITTGATTGLNLDIGGLEDWYVISVPAGMILNVDVLFVDTAGDIDARLEAPCGTFQDSSNTSTDNEDMTWNNDTGAAVNAVIRIDKDGTELCTPYDLSLSLVPDPCVSATNDAFEENDDCLTAAVVTPGLYPNLFALKETVDEDWFSVTINDGATISVIASFIDANGDVDMDLWDACAGTKVDASGGVTDTEDVAFTNNTGGPLDMKINVFMWNSASNVADCNDYDLDISVSGGMPVNLIPYCFGDGSGTPCPCGNNSTAGHPGGCANDSGNGAVLTASGNPSVAMDTLNLDLASASPSAFALLVSGNNQLPQVGACIGCGLVAFDGLRCAGGGFLRHGSRATDANGDTGNGWGPPGGPAGGLIAANGFTMGQVKHFFAFYRTNAATGCMTGQNSSNGITVTMQP